MGKTARRIWYGIAIFLSCLVVILSVVGIAGIWITERAMGNAVVQVLDAVSNVTGSLRQTAQTVDQKLASMQDITSSISTASASLSKQVADQGLIQLLLPEQQTQNLAEFSNSVKDAVNTLRDIITSFKSIYQTIDAIPFVNLPAPTQDQIDKMGESINTIQSSVDEVTNAITAFRAGASEKISIVTQAVDQLTNRLSESRTRLAELDTQLANLQDKLAQLQQIAQVVIFLLALDLSLFLAWVVYTQIEVIRLYTFRWRGAGASAEIEPAAAELADTKDEPASDTGSEAVSDQEPK
jgi:uncharacterized phage infection (PIP) family protein YhgE